MSKTTKNWLLAAAVLIWIGILLFGWVMSANHWDFSALSTVKYQTRTVEIPEDFRSITILSDTEDIDLVPAGDGVCRVEYYERKDESHKTSVQGGKLTIELEKSGNWLKNFLVFSAKAPRITLYLPACAFDALYIKESTGDVTIPGAFTFESVRIQASTGDVDCAASAAEVIQIETDTGDIRLHDLTSGELRLSVSTGKVDVRSAESRGELAVKVSTGRTTLTGVSCASLLSEGSTGDITMENVIADGLLSVERSTGDVRMTNCDASELEIKTDTGSVTGSLLSEKVFIAKSDTGRVEVPETVTGGRCRITTDTGSIRITLADVRA